jgi:hypothetical protein
MVAETPDFTRANNWFAWIGCVVAGNAFGTLRFAQSVVGAMRIIGAVHVFQEFPVLVGLGLSRFEYVNALTNCLLTFPIESRNLFGGVGAAGRLAGLYVMCRTGVASVRFWPLTLICMLLQDSDKSLLLAGKH